MRARLRTTPQRPARRRLVRKVQPRRLHRRHKGVLHYIFGLGGAGLAPAMPNELSIKAVRMAELVRPGRPRKALRTPGDRSAPLPGGLEQEAGKGGGSQGLGEQ